MSAHTHDDVNWAAKLPSMRRADALSGDALAAVADRLTQHLPDQATVVDIGSGSGGMSGALAASLARRGGGTLVLLDAVQELLDAASEVARAASADAVSAPGADASGAAQVRVRTIIADAADPDLRTLLPSADLVWASAVVHHLPDQQAAVDRLSAVLRPDGLLAVSEGGLETRCLPWDLGVGEPGLELRLNSARDVWFGELRAGMEGVVRMPHGWGTALTNAGLRHVTSFSYLVDHPAPAPAPVTEFAADRVAWLAEVGDDRITDADRRTAQSLVDPGAPEYLGHRSDVFLLSCYTVHCGWSR